MMHFNLSLLTALAVFVHLGTAIAGIVLKDRTDQRKIAEISAKTDQVLAYVTALAPAIPAHPPKTLSSIAGDLAAVAAALSNMGASQSTAPAPPVAGNTPFGGIS